MNIFVRESERNEEIDGEKKPSLKAKYCYENTNKKVETTFKFIV